MKRAVIYVVYEWLGGKRYRAIGSGLKVDLALQSACAFLEWEYREKHTQNEPHLTVTPDECWRVTTVFAPGPNA